MAGGGTASLLVDTEQLVTYGNYLVSTKENLDTCLNSLDEKMGTITNGWKDSDGEAFKAKFSQFITEAKKIDDELAVLGSYAIQVAAKYEKILEDSIRMIGE